MNGDISINWKEFVFEQSFLDTIDKISMKRFGDNCLAEEASAFIIEYLAFNDWERCKKFSGKSSPKTYLIAITNSALEEFARKRFGRVRPPLWLKNMGETWISLWKQLCLERQMPVTVIDNFTANGFRSESDVKDAIRIIKTRIPDCGKVCMDSIATENINELSDQQQFENNYDNDELYEEPLLEETFTMIKSLLEPEVNTMIDFSQTAFLEAEQTVGELSNKLAQLKKDISLSDEERILIRMVYVDGISKSSASRALGMPSHQAGRVINQCLERLASQLKSHEIELESLLQYA